MTTPNDPVIVSCYGSRVVELDAVTLCVTLGELRSERKECPRGHQMPDTDEDSQRLIAQAERIKGATENHIREVASSA